MGYRPGSPAMWKITMTDVKEQPAATRSRLTLDLSNRLTDALNAYAAKHATTKAETLRKAIELLLRADRAVDDGMRVVGYSVSGNERLERELYD